MLDRRLTLLTVTALALGLAAGCSRKQPPATDDGGGGTVLTSTGDNEDPSWSPDGLHIAFSSTRGGGSDIYTSL